MRTRQGNKTAHPGLLQNKPMIPQIKTNLSRKQVSHAHKKPNTSLKAVESVKSKTAELGS